MSGRKKTSVQFTLAGMQYYMPKDARVILAETVPFGIEIKREPKNEHDANAIAVYAHRENVNLWAGKQLGHIARSLAEVLAPAIDEGRLEFYIGKLTEINDLTGKGLGEITFIKTKKNLTTKKKSAKVSAKRKRKPK